jgi:hypothetical protein
MNERVRQVLLTFSVLGAIGASAVRFVPGDVVGWDRLMIVDIVLAPVTYTVSLLAAWILARGNKHVFWLLALAPFAFSRAAEFLLIMTIWTLRGGIV